MNFMLYIKNHMINILYVYNVKKLGGWDNNIYIYNLNYGNKIYSDQAHGDAISSLVFDSTRVITYLNE